MSDSQKESFSDAQNDSSPMALIPLYSASDALQPLREIEDNCTSVAS
ncbi:hypothetical protein L580_0983 [Serratia fonticola AU-P3(3)]|nr:hypothetical protein L580_0983 [Serratia fonticola AU-P3(3)]